MKFGRVESRVTFSAEGAGWVGSGHVSEKVTPV